MSTNIVAGSVSTDYETATSHTITVRETLAGASNSPRDTVLTINVIDVADGGGGWTPLSLGSKLIAYYDTKLSTITGTSPVTQVNDLSGNNYHMTNLGFGPTYNATGFAAGKPSLTFTVGNQILEVAGVALGGTSFWCAAIATADTSGASDPTLAGISDSGQPGQLLCFYRESSSTNIYTFRRSGLDSGPRTVTNNTRFRAYTRFNGTDNVLTIDGTSAAAVANTAAFDATVTLCMANIPDHSLGGWAGKVGVLIFGKGVLTGAEETNLDTWLQAW